MTRDRLSEQHATKLTTSRGNRLRGLGAELGIMERRRASTERQGLCMVHA